MPVTCDDVKRGLSALFSCAEIRGRIRIRTPFLYPDGEVVDLFLLQDDGRVSVTDFGETTRWLKQQTSALRRTPNQLRLIQDVCLTLGIEFFQGQLLLRATPDGLSDAVVRLGQACLRVADIWFTMRGRTAETFDDEVNDYLFESGFPHEQRPEIMGRSGKVLRPSFRVRGPQRSTILQDLSTSSRAAARVEVEHALRIFVDLAHLRAPELVFMSLFDDSSDVWSEDDFRLIRDHAPVFLWSQRQEVAEALRS